MRTFEPLNSPEALSLLRRLGDGFFSLKIHTIFEESQVAVFKNSAISDEARNKILHLISNMAFKQLF